MITESLEDFRKRYKGTYLFLNTRGKEHLVRYDSDNEEDFCFYSPEYGDLLVDEETARNCIRIFFPKPGLYNINNSVFEFTRNPLRQWKRAPCDDNSRLSLMEAALQSDYQTISLSTRLVSQLFFPTYPENLNEAIKNLKNSTALNLEFAITKHPKEELFLLWYHSNPIGTINTKTKEIDVKYKPLYQEVVDFFKKKEYSWTIAPKQ